MAWLKTKQTNSSMYSPYTEATVKSRRKFFSRLPLLWAFSLLQWDLHLMKCSLWSLASSRRCSRLPLQAELFPSSLEMGHLASYLSAVLLWPPKAKSHSLFHLLLPQEGLCSAQGARSTELFISDFFPLQWQGGQGVTCVTKTRGAMCVVLPTWLICAV